LGESREAIQKSQGKRKSPASPHGGKKHHPGGITGAKREKEHREEEEIIRDSKETNSQPTRA